MDTTILAALITLGFSSTTKKAPKLKTITKYYYDLAKQLHPDRPGGGDAEKFKDITLAYRIVGEYIEKSKVNHDDEDIEEMVARKVFKEFAFGNVKENLYSFTIHLENELSFLWRTSRQGWQWKWKTLENSTSLKSIIKQR